MRSQRFGDVWLLAGPAFALLVLMRRGLAYGLEWRFGRWCMPQTLTADGGVHYPNGQLIDPVTRWLVATGFEPEFYLFAFGCFAIGAIYIASLGRQIEAKRAAYLEACQKAAAYSQAHRDAAARVPANRSGGAH